MARQKRENQGSKLRTGAYALGAGGLFMVCCAALPLAAGLLASATIGAAFGIGAGVVALMVLGAFMFRRARRRARPVAAGQMGAAAEPAAPAERTHA